MNESQQLLTQLSPRYTSPLFLTAKSQEVRNAFLRAEREWVAVSRGSEVVATERERENSRTGREVGQGRHKRLEIKAREKVG